MLCLKNIYWRWGLPFPRNCSHACKMPKWDGIVPYRTLSQSAHTQKNVAQYFHYVSHPGPLCCQGQLLFCCLGPAIRLLPAQYQPSTFFFFWIYHLCGRNVITRNVSAFLFLPIMQCLCPFEWHKDKNPAECLTEHIWQHIEAKKTFVPWTVVFRWK